MPHPLRCRAPNASCPTERAPSAEQMMFIEIWLVPLGKDSS